MTDQFHAVAAALADRYTLLRELGAGGMATVYLAEDLKHDRKVAIKVLRPELAAVLGAERFIQEIKTTANLQHPNILPLFDSGKASVPPLPAGERGTGGEGPGGSAQDFLYYVMPFVEGETLRDKLNRETQLGIDEAVRLTTEVAEALDYAHRHGVIHRDIKPENILLHDGRPLVADFGIALAVSAAAGGRMTETGLSLGTPHYMSPEQATAEKELTARSDIYSLGAVLYEMLTGDPPHTGSSAQQIIMKIVTEEAAPLTRLRKSVPPNVAAAVARSLEKLPADRFEHAAGFAAALGDATFTLPAVTGADVGARGGPSRISPPALGLAALALAFLVTAGAVWLRPADRPVVALSLDLVSAGLNPTLTSDPEISPDGSTVVLSAFVAGTARVYVRRFDSHAFRPVRGSEGARSAIALSPDGQWMVYARNRTQLVKSRVLGGGAAVLVDDVQFGPFLPHWGTNETIVFTGNRGVYRISSEGGEPVRIGDFTYERTFRPHLLPDGSGVLVGGEAGIQLLDVETGRVTPLAPDGYHAVYVETGHILYVTARGEVYALPFDLRRKAITGPPAEVWTGVRVDLRRRGFSVSRSGTLVLTEGIQNVTDGNTVSTLNLVDRGGESALDLPEGVLGSPRYSRDGRQIAYTRSAPRELTRADIWTVDLATGDAEQLTFEGNNRTPLWSPDGRQVLFQSVREGSDGRDLYVKPADNSGPARNLLRLPGDQDPADWLPDGRIVFVSVTSDDLPPHEAGGEIRVWDPASDGTPRRYDDRDEFQMQPAVSPDGSLLAFVAFRRGAARDIWIREFPRPTGRYRVSSREGYSPRWSPDGSTLYYFTRDGPGSDSLKAVTVDRGTGVRIRESRTVLVTEYRGFDVHPDGTGFVVAVASYEDGGTGTRFRVVLNWLEQLKRTTGNS